MKALLHPFETLDEYIDCNIIAPVIYRIEQESDINRFAIAIPFVHAYGAILVALTLALILEIPFTGITGQLVVFIVMIVCLAGLLLARVILSLRVYIQTLHSLRHLSREEVRALGSKVSYEYIRSRRELLFQFCMLTLCAMWAMVEWPVAHSMYFVIFDCSIACLLISLYVVSARTPPPQNEESSMKENIVPA